MNARRDWRDAAACRREDPDLFFPIGSGPEYGRQVAVAKDVCRRCPVMAACLSDALDGGLDHGVFGGLDEDERRAIRRAPQKASA